MTAKKKISRWIFPFSIAAGFGAGFVFVTQTAVDIAVSAKYVAPIFSYALPLDILGFAGLSVVGYPLFALIGHMNTNKRIRRTTYATTHPLTGDLVTTRNLNKLNRCIHFGIVTGIALAAGAEIISIAISPNGLMKALHQTANELTNHVQIASRQPGAMHENCKPVLTFKR